MRRTASADHRYDTTAEQTPAASSPTTPTQIGAFTGGTLFRGAPANVSFFVAVAACVIVWWVIWHPSRRFMR